MDLAGELLVLDEAQVYGRRAVPQGVGDQLADDFLGVLGSVLVHAPVGELAPGVASRDGRGGGLFVQRPGGDAVGGEGAGAGEEKDGVAGKSIGPEPVEDVVAQVLQGAGLGKSSLQLTRHICTR
ncbi:hypothetical protein [Streptomyces sp. NPDC052107]|uniref:hypothetical protein n=1 Tax=Streptomyces sp. NPDC052107 TaxID=3155632 RepID=UPI003449FC2B